MREFLSGPLQTLRKALLPLDCGEQWSGGVGGSSSVFEAMTAATVASGGINAIHESLIKVLLRVDCIQPEVYM